MTLRLFKAPHRPERSFEPFDLFFCWAPDRISRTISLATSWPLGPARFRHAPAHVAFCIYTGDTPVWVEATSLSDEPCMFHGKIVAGCQVHPIHSRIAEYRRAGGRVEQYRLLPHWQFSPAESSELTRMAISDFVAENIGYDVEGALFSGARVFKLLDLVIGGGLFPPAGLHQLFCSEWAAAMAMRFDRLALDNCSRYTPAELGRAMVSNGVMSFHRSFDPDHP